MAVKKQKQFYVYILVNKTGTLYSGITNDLLRRVSEHKRGKVAGFTKRYNVNRLIYYEETNNVQDALNREKQIKGWTRKKKLDLVRTTNPTFKDLSIDWFDGDDS